MLILMRSICMKASMDSLTDHVLSIEGRLDSRSENTSEPSETGDLGVSDTSEHTSKMHLTPWANRDIDEPIDYDSLPPLN